LQSCQGEHCSELDVVLNWLLPQLVHTRSRSFVPALCTNVPGAHSVIS
jgi:hypothetical protein